MLGPRRVRPTGAGAPPRGDARRRPLRGGRGRRDGPPGSSAAAAAYTTALLLLAGACAGSGGAPEPAPAGPSERARSPLGTRTVQLLERVVRIDTAGGDETAAARQIAAFLEASRVTSEVLTWRPGRASLVARLGPEGGPPVVLLSHLDAPPAEARRWPEGEGPFDGTRRGGELIGRGVLGGKGLAVVHAHIFTELAAREADLRRPVILVALAGGLEIDGGAGPALLEAKPELGRDDALVLTVGGYTFIDPDGSDRWLHWVTIAEPGWAEIDVTAVGDASDPAGVRLARALPAVVEEGPRTQLTASAWAAMVALRESAPALAVPAYRAELLARLLVLPRWAKRPVLSALVQESVEVMELSSGQDTPASARARAALRCRYLPGTTTGDLRARFVRLANAPRIFFTLASWAEPVASAAPGPSLADRLLRSSQRVGPRQVMAYGLAVQPTPAAPFRAAGAQVFGHWPLPVRPEAWSLRDEPGERVDLEAYLESADRLRELVLELSLTPP